MLYFGNVNVSETTVLLCDADGNLFPSEEPAFVTSAKVTNDFLERFGISLRLSPTELRLATTGKNFRTTAIDLLLSTGIPVELSPAAPRREAPTSTARGIDGEHVLTREELEWWVSEEKQQVTAGLAGCLRPDPSVIGPLSRLASHYLLTAVSSSATSRLDACFTVTGLDPFIPAHLRFSAEDSLPVPTGKPHPAVYRHVATVLGITGRQGLAVEDSVPGAQSAIAAGFPTIGNVQFVPRVERPERIRLLQDAGVAAVMSSWQELEDLLLPATAPP